MFYQITQTNKLFLEYLDVETQTCSKTTEVVEGCKVLTVSLILF